jgi:hypothetical protein
LLTIAPIRSATLLPVGISTLEPLAMRISKFALKHYDWERIEKTKGELIDDQVGYISDVFDTVTGEVHKSTDYFGQNRKSVSSSFEKQKSIYFKTGSWEIHNRRFGETDVLTNTACKPYLQTTGL